LYELYSNNGCSPHPEKDSKERKLKTATTLFKIKLRRGVDVWLIKFGYYMGRG
jgi:hypothetical protein